MQQLETPVPAWLQQKLWSITDPFRVDQATLLENIADDLSPTDKLSRSGIAAIFTLFERFCETDCGGVFYKLSVVLEAQSETPSALVRSLHRRPSVMGLRLLNRFLVDGVETCEGLSLKNLLHSIYLQHGLPKAVADEAAHFVSIHDP